MKGSYFPILVKYAGDSTTTVVDHPNDIRSGVVFKVIQCNVTK